jgi:hypothetical protein
MSTFHVHDVQRSHYHRDLPGDTPVLLVPTDVDWDCRGPCLLRDGLAVYHDKVGEHTARVRATVLGECGPGARVLAQLDPDERARGEWWLVEVDKIDRRAH